MRKIMRLLRRAGVKGSEADLSLIIRGEIFQGVTKVPRRTLEEAHTSQYETKYLIRHYPERYYFGNIPTNRNYDEGDSGP